MLEAFKSIKKKHLEAKKIIDEANKQKQVSTGVDYKTELRDDIARWLYDDEVREKGWNFLDFVGNYSPYLSIKDITTIYNQTAGQPGIYGPPTESAKQIQTAYSMGKQGKYTSGPKPGGG